jgi:hypothetical protein
LLKDTNIWEIINKEKEENLIIFYMKDNFFKKIKILKNKILTIKIQKTINIPFEEFILRYFSSFDKFNLNEKRDFSGNNLFKYQSLNRKLKILKKDENYINYKNECELLFPENKYIQMFNNASFEFDSENSILYFFNKPLINYWNKVNFYNYFSLGK